MKLSLQNQIRFMRGFWGVETRLADGDAVDHYLRAPFTLVSANTQQPNLVCLSRFSHILKIAVPRHLAQIAKSVVTLIAVYVVDMLRRPLAGHVSPRKSVRELLSVVDSYRPIPCGLGGPRRFADKIGSPFMRSPCKDAGIGVVIQRRAQMLNRAWWVYCHDNASTIGGLK